MGSDFIIISEKIYANWIEKNMQLIIFFTSQTNLGETHL